ncbi:peroxidase A2 [Physcomitrium patens]|uniref:Peroxidase n=1 Tax=Physcomitrium patens TaxID=3218 RepID=A0A2K1KX56_PHYPA|nr:peroxidase A2-like [Physcomitrium patens]PNR58375.1 hypothetical protein PHYPA_005370 [Physcomitrium patens]|eukprot:XP_024370012.1 peroxidase A2-like [Physcomitrella patens]
MAIYKSHSPQCAVWMALTLVTCVGGKILSVAATWDDSHLTPSFYDNKCPHLQKVVSSKVEAGRRRDQRLPASVLRLHFHDCFVNGCDGSILLDDRPGFVGEKSAAPNLNSARGFELIDDIKQDVEALCPDTVSCADILTIAARDSVALSGGPYWEVQLGRRDSLTASKTDAENSIPQPTFTVTQLVASFNAVGLNEKDVVALSGSHSFGKARCTSFQNRLGNQASGSQSPGSDPFLESSYLAKLQTLCPSNGDGNTTVNLDHFTPVHFDNQYYKNLQAAKGLLNSDAVLHTTNGQSNQLVEIYANDERVFFKDFAQSVLKMGSIKVMTGNKGEVRRNCRLPNTIRA